MEKTAIKPAFAIEEKAENMDIVEEPVHSIAATADIVDGFDTVQKVVEYDFSSSESVVLELDITNNVSPVLNENKSSIPEISTIQQEEKPTTYQTSPNSKPLSSGFLVKPTIIYENESKQPANSPVAVEEVTSVASANFIQEEEKKNEDEGMQLVYRELSIETPTEVEIPEITSSSLEEQIVINEDEAQRAKAAERLYKLRNLSYNFNAADPNNEYENVPAYVRHNFHVNSNTMATVEKFYSNYAIETDDNNNTHISTINTFLEGKKPD
jgi:cell division protein FtsZ